jgi:hypothetical protein
MTKKKVSNKKPTKKRSSKPKEVIKEITTVEEKTNDGHWTKIIRVKYIKQLLCPGFLSDRIIMYLAAIPLTVLIGIILWRIFSYE